MKDIKEIAARFKLPLLLIICFIAIGGFITYLAHATGNENVKLGLGEDENIEEIAVNGFAREIADQENDFFGADTGEDEGELLQAEVLLEAKDIDEVQETESVENSENILNSPGIADSSGTSSSEQEEIHTPNNSQQDVKLDGYLNQYVLNIIKTYQIGGGRYPYLLNNDYANYNGVTTNIYYQNRLLLKAHPSGNRASHCSGITFEVFFKAMQERNRQLGISPDDFNGMNADQLFDLAMIWYVAAGNKRVNNVAVAVEKYGIGKQIHRLEDAQPGDFLDFSRENNTGHTVVFLNWLKEGDQIVGLRYWSSQQSTNGINYVEEYFNVRDKNGRKYGNVMIDQVYIARVQPVSEYRSR